MLDGVTLCSSALIKIFVPESRQMELKERQCIIPEFHQ